LRCIKIHFYKIPPEVPLKTRVKETAKIKDVGMIVAIMSIPGAFIYLPAFFRPFPVSHSLLACYNHPYNLES
jgi:hypothetical protein